MRPFGVFDLGAVNQARWVTQPIAFLQAALRLPAILAAIVLTLLPEVLRPVAEYRMILYSLLLIVLMIARPQGLFRLKPRPKRAGP